MSGNEVATIILTTARALIAKGWCKDSQARDADGLEVLPNDPSAKKFCVLGALDRCCVNNAEGLGSFRAAQELIREQIGTRSITEWNDNPRRRKREVLAVFDEAITRARSAPLSDPVPGE